jgi:hypothetical protein
VKIGDLVKIFAASLQPVGLVVGSSPLGKMMLVFWCDDVHWLGQSKLEVIDG